MAARIRLPGSITKNGKPALHVISATLAQSLVALISSDAHPNAPAFPAGIPRGSTIRRDLVRAKIPAIDAEGRRVDLHALRKTFGTHLVLSGAQPRVVMEAMRHGDLKLTMKTYMDAAQLQGPVLAAVAALPWNQSQAKPAGVAS
jgi:integrase